MTPDAVGRASLVVARHARENVTARSAAVEIAAGRLGAEPAHGVRTHAADAGGAHAAVDVTGVARRHGVAAKAGGRLRPGLQRMPGHEVAAVGELTVDSIRLPALDGKASVVVVAFGTPGFRMALSADARLTASGDAVSTQPAGVVTHEALGHPLAEILRPMAGCALGALELCFVAGQADAHGRCAGCLAGSVEHAGMTAVALATDGREREVGAVREEDGSPGRGREASDLQRASEPMLAVLVAVGTGAHLGWRNLRDLFRVAVTTGTGQALGLPGVAARQLEVLQVRESGRRWTVAGCEAAGPDQDGQEQDRAEPSATGRRARFRHRRPRPGHHGSRPTVSSS
ncbi:MAG: hypothetical protein JW940_29525 [Polyangiaceae bacterium]|nr:hypothetical protein [Polyangiaceae bacterium]